MHYSGKLYLIGAEFDRDVMNRICARHPDIISICQLPPSRLFSVLKHAAFFIGYQSGMSILADNLGIRHLIIYFDKLKAMRDSWGHPHRRATHFRHCLFSDGIDHAAKIVREFCQ
jgi:hypothetical protein